MRLQCVSIWGMFGDSSFTLVVYPRPEILDYLEKKRKKKIPGLCYGIVLLII